MLAVRYGMSRGRTSIKGFFGLKATLIAAEIPLRLSRLEVLLLLLLLCCCCCCTAAAA
jgi:hypothetical protein